MASSTRRKSVSANPCYKCLKDVENGSKALQCDGCKVFVHLSCGSGVTNKMYEALNRKSENNLVYMCQPCKTLFHQTTSVISHLNEQNENIRSIQDQLKQQSETVSEKLAQIQASVSKLTADIGLINQEVKGEIETANQKSAEILSAHSKSAESMHTKWAELAANLQGSNPYMTKPSPPQGNDEYDSSLVIYNLSSEKGHPIAELLEVLSKAGITDDHLISTTRIKSNNKSYPIKVTVIHKGIKWKAIKQINQLKINKVFAKPFQSGAELRTDRLLRLKVAEIRSKMDGSADIRTVKIRKGKVVRLNLASNSVEEELYSPPGEDIPPHPSQSLVR